MAARKKKEAPAQAPQEPASPEAELQGDIRLVTGTVTIASSEIRMWRLGDLQRAVENVRATASDADIDELADDIFGHGLLQSLIGYQIEVEARPRGCIVAGGRRLLALDRLCERESITLDYEVPVLIRERREAIELSLAENLARRDMSPVDEFRAFKALMDLHPGEVGTKELARRFGYTEAHVKQRMRLADLHEDILQALTDRVINLDAAYAYATSQDPAVQLQTFKEQCKSNWKPHDPGYVRSAIAGHTYGESDRLVSFVGLPAYEAAGGRYEDDLFLDAGQERRLIDTAIVDRLVRETAEAAIPALVKKNKAVADGIFALSDNYGSAIKVKPPKGMAAFEGEYHYFDADAMWKAARELGVAVTGIYRLDRDDKLSLYRNKFIVSKADKARIEEVKAAQRAARSAPSETPEQRAARARQMQVDIWSRRLAVGSFAGSPLEGRAYWPSGRDTWGDTVREWRHPELGEGFSVRIDIFVSKEAAEAQLEAANAKVDAIAALDEKAVADRAAEAEAAQRRRAAEAENQVAEKQALLAAPPGVIVIDAEPCFFYRQEDGAYPDVRDVEAEIPEYGFETLEELIDHAHAIGSQIRTWPTLEAFDEAGGATAALADPAETGEVEPATEDA